MAEKTRVSQSPQEFFEEWKQTGAIVFNKTQLVERVDNPTLFEYLDKAFENLIADIERQTKEGELFD